MALSVSAAQQHIFVGIINNQLFTDFLTSSSCSRCRIMKLVSEDDLVREEKLLSEVVSKHVHSLVPRRKEQKSAGSETPQRPAMLAETSQSHTPITTTPLRCPTC